VPFVSELARKSGATLACNPDVDRLLHQGNLVGVFPEGFKGVGKHYSERYKLQRFGRAGFVSVALRNRTPIVPAAIVGAEETFPMLGNIKPLARLMGLPYFPVTPTFPWLGPLGAVPLPSKWMMRFGEPIDAYCNRHGLGLEARVKLFIDVLAAVAHAHSHLIVHRDIKPANIIITPDGRAKITDFGIAKLAVNQLTMPGEALGTPSYMSPEQIAGGSLDGRSELGDKAAVLRQCPLMVDSAVERPLSGPWLTLRAHDAQECEPSRSVVDRRTTLSVNFL
jgi:hypothetical protein